MKYRVDWKLSGSSEVEADNALDAALAVSDCAYVEQGQTFEVIKMVIGGRSIWAGYQRRCVVRRQ